MISWITLRGSAPGSACAAIAHRFSPGWTITELRFWYTAEGGGPLRAASARVAPPIHARTATSRMTATTTADSTIRPRLVSRERERATALDDCKGGRRAAGRARSAASCPGAGLGALGRSGAAGRALSSVPVRRTAGVPGCSGAAGRARAGAPCPSAAGRAPAPAPIRGAGLGVLGSSGAAGPCGGTRAKAGVRGFAARNWSRTSPAAADRRRGGTAEAR